MVDVEQALAGTPYLIANDDDSARRFEALRQTSAQTRERALRANEHIVKEAHEVLEPYMRATRTELVAESNIMEGMQWTPTEAREVVYKNRELLDGPVRTLVESVRADSRVYQVLGLYRAHEIAEEWSKTERPPLASEIRQLHHLVLGSVPGSGEYKVFSNAISGTTHRTTEPQDVPRVMLELSDWWAQASEDPLLTATVVHAWLAHIHPFDDGNGRTARVLANLELARHGYPPLVLRPGSDRGQYYAALASSDDGDILPLYELFVHAIRRQVRLMSKPGYVLGLIEDKFLASERDRHRFWMTNLTQFSNALEYEIKRRGAEYRLQGMLDGYSFALLCKRDAEGNGWFATIGTPQHPEEWLLWFGFRSKNLVDLMPEDRPYPSIFISRRDHSPGAIHPYSQHFDRTSLLGDVPDELSVVPAVPQPVGMRYEFDFDNHPIEYSAQVIAEALCANLATTDI